MMMSKPIHTVFNDHFQEFLDDIRTLFPDDPDIASAETAFAAARSANPRLLIQVWKNIIVRQYRTEIEAGNIEFFINKDYTEDVKSNPFSEKIMKSINRLREPMRNMSDSDKEKTMGYLRNFTELTDLYQEK